MKRTKGTQDIRELKIQRSQNPPTLTRQSLSIRGTCTRITTSHHRNHFGSTHRPSQSTFHRILSLQSGPRPFFFPCEVYCFSNIEHTVFSRARHCSILALDRTRLPRLCDQDHTLCCACPKQLQLLSYSCAGWRKGWHRFNRQNAGPLVRRRSGPHTPQSALGCCDPISATHRYPS